MTIRLLLPYDDYPIGARLSRDLVFETEMVAKNLATFDLTGSFQWPMESADEILGPFSSVATLEMAYPAYRYAGFTSLVGTSAPYAVYFSDGQAWLAKLGGKTNPLTGGIEVSAGSTNLKDIFASQVSSGYYCHLFAADSSNGDAVVPDISGAQSHGAFSSGMTKAIAWGTAGFASTNNAAPFQNFIMPAINWDYLNGESLIITWKGRGTPPASTKAFMANSTGSSDPGFALRAQTDGRIQMYISGGTGVFLQPSVLVAFETSVTHAFSVVIDGVKRKYALVEDGNESRSMALIDSGNNIDTRTTDALLLGTQDVTGVASNAVVSQTQALVILRGRAGKGLPTNWLELTKAIQRNPGRLVTTDQW